MSEKQRMERAHEKQQLGRTCPVNVMTMFSTSSKKSLLDTNANTINFNSIDINRNALQQWNEITRDNENPPDLFLAKVSKSILLKMDTFLSAKRGEDYSNNEWKELLAEDPKVDFNVSNILELMLRYKETFHRIEVVPLATQMLLADRTKMQGVIKKVCTAVNTIAALNNMAGIHAPMVNGFTNANVNGCYKLIDAVDSEDSFVNGASDDKNRIFHINSMTNFHQNDIDRQFKEKSSLGNLKNHGHHEKFLHTKKSDQHQSVTTNTDIGNLIPHKKSSEYKWKTVVRQPHHIIIDSNDLKDSTTNLKFPLVIKSASAMEEKVALVPNMQCLLHFRKERMTKVPGMELVAEEYIPHSNTVLKIGLIGKQIFVVRRPSIPDVFDFRKENLIRVSRDVKGHFVEVRSTECEFDGYLTFSSMTTEQAHCLASQKLEECRDLDIDTIKNIVHILSRSLGLKLLGVDILVSAKDGAMHIVDINAFPQFSDIENKEAIILEYLEEEARKRAFLGDSHNLCSKELLELGLEHSDLWKNAMISVEDMCLKTIRKNRIYEIRIENNIVDDDDRFAKGGKIHLPVQNGVTCNHEKTLDGRSDYHERSTTSEMHNGVLVNTTMLLKFRNFHTPGRMISDKLKFDMNISKHLTKHGLGPGGMSVILATYFGKTTEVGYVRDWVHGVPLKNYLQQYRSEDSLELLRTLFRSIGVNVAQFHQLLQKPDFHRDIVKHHFPGDLASQPVAPVRFKVWQQEAIALLNMSNMSVSRTWKHFYNKLMSGHHGINDICQNIVMALESFEANALVFGHFDCNVNNIIVSAPSEDKIHTCLIDEEWACPNMAAYDFGKLVSSVIMMMKRKETVLRKDELEELVKELTMCYLKSLKSLTGKKQEEKVEVKNVDKHKEKEFNGKQLDLCGRFSRDIWRFTAYAALLNSYSNLIHASKDGQLSSIEEDFQLTLSSSGDFNWIRYAYDHYLIFEEFRDE